MGLARKIANSVFKYMIEKSFTPTNIKFGDTYFIFSHGEDCVINFDVKGLHGWKFGMWIDTNIEELNRDSNRKMLVFFAQHKDNIDKFKPSCSALKVEYSIYQIKLLEKNYYEINELLNHIKYNPIAAYGQDADCCYYSSNNYYKLYFNNKKDKIERKLRDCYMAAAPIIQHKYKIYFLNQSEIVDHVDFIDENKDGWECSPRYSMLIHFKKLYDEEVQNEMELQLLKKWFKKNLHSYENIFIECFRPDVEGCYTYDIKRN